MSDGNRNNGYLKDWLVGVLTALTVACLGVVANLYTDVQVMKVQVHGMERYAETVVALDKKMDLTNQTLEAVKETLNEIKSDRLYFRNGDN